ncbi:MAG: hypothetical protein Q8O29_15535 [Polaromonas sp.]|uniref:hypothetical protein n=1 Tax=Polaromonas sp. TaxID=1869339 RepID=UPI002734ED69|nr:hypothetical protein [Polaromonas sp.]MDP2819648.1 hypothetical protein [Polaromonas sp.]
MTFIERFKSILHPTPLRKGEGESRPNHCRVIEKDQSGDAIRTPQIKNPGQLRLTGADGEHDAHAVGLRKEEKFVFSAMRASDCSQVYREWLPSECLRYSSNCRINLPHAAGKSIFVIKKERTIAVFWKVLHLGVLSYIQSATNTDEVFLAPVSMLQRFL